MKKSHLIIVSKYLGKKINIRKKTFSINLFQCLNFRDGAQVCYCGSSNCRGFISKATPITGLSNSEDSEDATEDNSASSGENKKKKKILNKRTVYNNENKLREVFKYMLNIK